MWRPAGGARRCNRPIAWRLVGRQAGCDVDRLGIRGGTPLRHFDYLDSAERERLFLKEPEVFTAHSELEAIGAALGASLYLPATRPDISGDLQKQAGRGVTSTIVCLEDSVADCDLAGAEQNAVRQLRCHAHRGADSPLIFVRVRTPSQIQMITEALGDDRRVISGFVLPKFTARTGSDYVKAVIDVNNAGQRVLAMPVLESPEMIHAESRIAELLDVKMLLDSIREYVPAVRIGATDLSSVYGLRRARDLTVYDVRVIADVIADIVNVFGRTGSNYVITGTVWEHFSGEERLFKSQLREAPFAAQGEQELRTQLLARDLDGLLREVALDKANGLMGKTVIHPTHVAAVHALSVVTHEEYADALDILRTAGNGGVLTSSYGNKMNESRPHREWAWRTARRAAAFGVARAEVSFVELLGAGLHW